MANFPKDRFDELPEDLTRVGAHRAPGKKGRGWIGFAWALLATGVLVFGGLFGISRVLDIDLGLPFIPVEVTPTPTPTPTPTMDPITDPATIDPARQITITVLNGTPIAGLETSVGGALAAAGWPVVTMATTATDDIEETFVYYTQPADEDVARGVVVALGVGGIRLVEPGTISSAPITVVLGADYEVAPATE